MRTFRIPFKAMASACEVVLAAGNEAQALAWAKLAVDEVTRIETTYSRYRSDSIVSRINAAAGGAPVECDAETSALFDHAQALYDNSDGLFDITSGVLRRVWDFKAARRPGEAELAAVRRLIGWSRVEREGRYIRLPEADMEIDFGGFGKEYAADRAAGALQQGGAAHGYVNLAGDMRVIGPRPDGTPWRMGIQHPRHRDQLVATLPVSQGGLATSGDYERYFEQDGQRFCHILDVRSGQPVTNWRSISVLAPLAVLAGNCCTIAMLKQDQALEFLEASGMNYLAVDRHGVIHVKEMAAA